jgi:hypothetical protein
MQANQPLTQPEPAPSAPTADAYPRPEQVGIGDTGVFAGDWSTYERDGATRVPVGFAGTLVDWWNGWAVFTCTRQVAEAIVSQQEGLRDAERRRLHRAGLTGQDLTDSLDEMILPMYWDGEEIVLDESAQYGPDEGISRIGHDKDGRYNVNGWRWTWQLVNPADCDIIAGAVPLTG